MVLFYAFHLWQICLYWKILLDSCLVHISYRGTLHRDEKEKLPFFIILLERSHLLTILIFFFWFQFHSVPEISWLSLLEFKDLLIKIFSSESLFLDCLSLHCYIMLSAFLTFSSCRDGLTYCLYLVHFCCLKLAVNGAEQVD